MHTGFLGFQPGLVLPQQVVHRHVIVAQRVEVHKALGARGDTIAEAASPRPKKSRSTCR